jgi:hypothetical protein
MYLLKQVSSDSNQGKSGIHISIFICPFLEYMHYCVRFTMESYQRTRNHCVKIVQSVPIVVEATFDNDFIIQHILSFIGDQQYRYIASVNRTFHNAYCTLFPNKETHCDASTMELMMYSYYETPHSQRSYLCKSAAIHGNITALEYLKSKGYYLNLDNGGTMKAIVMNGHLHVMKWVHSNGLVVEWYVFVIQAALYGNMTMIQWLYTNHGSVFNEQACAFAARGGHLHILKWLRTKGCCWDRFTCLDAAENGHFEVLQWAKTDGCPWDIYTCSNAAKNGHLAILQWARENGCPWDEYVCTCAAGSGHFEILHWARENGCPWDCETCIYAAMYGQFELLKWAREHGCPWDTRVTRWARRCGHYEIFEWAKANGCPTDQ